MLKLLLKRLTGKGKPEVYGLRSVALESETDDCDLQVNCELKEYFNSSSF